MIRTAKFGGGMAGVLLVCLCLLLAFHASLRLRIPRRILRSHYAHFVRRSANDRLSAFGKVVFWAWERPEDLRFLQDKNVGVAFLVKTIYIPAPDEDTHKDDGGSLIQRPRLQPFRVAPGTPLIAVIRIETRASRQPQILSSNGSNSFTHYTLLQQQTLASEIVDMAGIADVRAIQIDFDATRSERDFYIQLLKDVRQKLPPEFPLSITALASWCIGDRWLDELPPGTIDEAVPMLFRMGPYTARVSSFLHSGEEFPSPACQNSLGLSTDEPLSQSILNGSLSATPATRNKRIYIFAPHSWTQAEAESILKEVPQ